MAQEKLFENKIKKYLTSKGCWYIKYWGGAEFTKAGIPDLLASINGYFVAIEVKAEKGKVSELQKYQIEKIKKSNGIAFVLYPKDFEKFKELVEVLCNTHIQESNHLINVLTNLN